MPKTCNEAFCQRQDMLMALIVAVQDKLLSVSSKNKMFKIVEVRWLNMNELIKVNYDNDNPTISARELYEFIEVTERFSSWFERMSQYGFEESVDYLGCKFFNTQASQELQDYQLQLIYQDSV